MDDKNPKGPLDDPDAPITDEERVVSERLRDALADPRQKNDGAELARAVSLAFEPRALTDEEHRALVDRALSMAAPRTNVRVGAFGAKTRARAVATVAAALALAAATVLLFGRLASVPTESVALVTKTPLLQTRSTQALFEEPFGRSGGASARIDRIAMARSTDLRENRFAKWGVR